MPELAIVSEPALMGGLLTRSGQLVAASPAERASRERVAAYRQAMEEGGFAPCTVAGRLQQLGNALRAIAPAQDWI